MDHLEYEELINPEIFYKDWTDEEFIIWITRPSVDEDYLSLTLKNLESSQMYEKCYIVKQLLELYEEHKGI
tara:strand:- start:3252 stop:3464 length:213 start_codon:yes stop_codon:yes gene_type:complete